MTTHILAMAELRRQDHARKQAECAAVYGDRWIRVDDIEGRLPE